MTQQTEYTYYRLDFKNCGTEYDYVICKDAQEVVDYLELSDLDTFDPDTDPESEKPSITITPVVMTESEHEQYVKQMEETA